MNRKLGSNSNKNKQISLPSATYIIGTNDSSEFLTCQEKFTVPIKEIMLISTFEHLLVIRTGKESERGGE